MLLSRKTRVGQKLLIARCYDCCDSSSTYFRNESGLKAELLVSILSTGTQNPSTLKYLQPSTLKYLQPSLLQSLVASKLLRDTHYGAFNRWASSQVPHAKEFPYQSYF